MAKPHRFRFDLKLLAAAAALAVIGVIMVFDTSSALAADKLADPFHFALNQLGGAALGILVMLAVAAAGQALYEQRWFVFGLLGLSFGLLALSLTMPEVASTHRWIVLAGIRFQPSELAKIAVILFLARTAADAEERINEPKTFLPAVAALGGVVLLILLEPDFGTAVLTFGVGCLLLLIGGVRWKRFLVIGLAAVPVFVTFVLLSPYKIVRVLEFFTKNKDLQKASYQVEQSRLAVASGGLLGASFGEGTQKYFLPAPHTDFIFSVVAEELGLLGSLVVLGLFLVLIWRGLAISLKAPTFASQLVAAGLTLLLAFQALINISVVLGLTPAKGVPLPLISFGRSSLLCSLLAVGILLHISKRRPAARGNA